MTTQRLTQNDVEIYALRVNPKRVYVSSSTGVTGSLTVLGRSSTIEKDISLSSSLGDSAANDQSIDDILKKASLLGRVGSSNASVMSAYMSEVNRRNQSRRNSATQLIDRIVPGFVYNDKFAVKSLVKNSLLREQRLYSNAAQYAYTNYNCLNFFSCSNVPTASVLIYPMTGSEYTVTGAFTIEAYIKPNSADDSSVPITAGAIVHVSSSYCLSLITGSGRDQYGRANTFRVALQLERTAEKRPSELNPSVAAAYPRDLAFYSDDCLKLNAWHHVLVRWGTNSRDRGTGSFYVDGTLRGTFVVPSSSLNSLSSNALFVGNFYEGNNTGGNAQALWFATNPSTREGLINVTTTPATEEPANFNFRHRLRAEIHDLKIIKRYVTNREIEEMTCTGSSDMRDVAFYLPPYFIPTSPTRSAVDGYGGILETPFYASDGSTETPFNTSLAFSVGGHLINIENFLYDFGSKRYPLAYNMLAHEISTTTAAAPANDLLYQSGSFIARNLLILPCDDGNYIPNLGVISTYVTAANNHYRDSTDTSDGSWINLRDLISTSSLLAGRFIQATSSIDKVIGGVAPETGDIKNAPGSALTIFNRTKDSNSNQITVFSISNLYYGDKITPGTFKLSSSLSGTNGALSVLLRDDGNGNLYRANCVTSASAWNSVGNIFYEQGIVFVKSPHLYPFGNDSYGMEFEGSRDVNVVKLTAIAPAGHYNTSSNTNFVYGTSSYRYAAQDEPIVKISRINFHDSNFNVVIRAHLAQPIEKRFSQSIVFKPRIDYLWQQREKKAIERQKDVSMCQGSLLDLSV